MSEGHIIKAEKQKNKRDVSAAAELKSAFYQRAASRRTVSR